MARDDDSERRFKYRKRDADETRKRAKNQGGSFHRIFNPKIKDFRMKNGEYRLRILPPTWEDAKHYGYDVWVHRNIGPDQGTYVCPSKMYKKPCPVCEEHARAIRDKEDQDYIKSLKPTNVVGMYIIDRDQEKEGPLLMSMPWTMDRDFSALAEDKKTREVLPIDDPEDGYDISFGREGKGRQVRYIGLQVDRRPSALADDEETAARWLKYIQKRPIPDMVVSETYDELKEILEGTPAPKDEKKRSRGDDDDDDDRKPKTRDRYVDDDDDDADEKPRKRKRVEIDDDDEDLDDDKPAKRTRVKAKDEDDDDDRTSRKRRREDD